MDQRELSSSPLFNDTEWRTFKRVLPLDVHEEMKHFESLVATHSGLPPRFEGIGDSVSVWSVIVQHLRNSEAELIELAKEWAGDKKSA